MNETNDFPNLGGVSRGIESLLKVFLGRAAAAMLATITMGMIVLQPGCDKGIKPTGTSTAGSKPVDTSSVKEIPPDVSLDSSGGGSN